MPEDRALNVSDYLGRMVARSIEDQAFSGNLFPTGHLTIEVLAAADAAVASDDAVVIRDDRGRIVRFGLDQERAMWVGFVTALGGLHGMLTSNGAPSTQAMVIVGAVAGFCIARLTD